MEADIPASETSRQSVARLAFGLGMVALALWTFAEYLPALGWAGVIAIATWPFYKRMRARVGHGGWAQALPALFAVVIGLVFLAPIIEAGLFLGREAHAATVWLGETRKNGLPVPAGLESLKYVGPYIASVVARQSRRSAESFHASCAASTRSPSASGWAWPPSRRIIVFLFTILALFFMYRDGDSLVVALRRLGERAFGPRGPEIGERIVHSVHGTVDGLVLVGLGEGLLLTIAYYFLGVPQLLLMGVATCIGCIIPFGAFVMFSLAAVLLVAKGAMFGALFIFAFGLVVLTAADHFVRPYVIGNATQLPFLFVLVGILGGVETFGMLGLFLGPAIMAVLVDLWREVTD